MSIKSKSGNTGKFHFKVICMIAFDTDSLLVEFFYFIDVGFIIVLTNEILLGWLKENLC